MYLVTLGFSRGVVKISIVSSPIAFKSYRSDLVYHSFVIRSVFVRIWSGQFMILTELSEEFISFPWVVE